ncbi:hypothetical protein [Sediminibacter sp. Hel_I_10]|uniref:hypothetical protein n=1 Tax=Sediminibacter sp. Hel_I_10 TaxID=1392490 RepID=UPI00047BFAEA|nr:hypothetical protein [Sediminibacter sp. Hel_I_10]
MQKAFAIAFSLLVLVQSLKIGVEDISNLNVLLNHAEFHQNMYGDSFFQFLAEHYGDAVDNHPSDHKDHENLPFKHHHQTCVHSSIAFTFETSSFDLDQQLFIDIPFNFFYEESSSLFEKLSVFQPPKMA